MHCVCVADVIAFASGRSPRRVLNDVD